MARIDKLTVEVATKLTVSDETAKRCISLLEMWMDDNPDKNIVCDLVPCKDMMRHRLRIERLRQEVSAPPQKKPLCDDCKHAIDGVVDDFATVFCAVRHCGKTFHPNEIVREFDPDSGPSKKGIGLKTVFDMVNEVYGKDFYRYE